jgi:hypothetical protein
VAYSLRGIVSWAWPLCVSDQVLISYHYSDKFLYSDLDTCVVLACNLFLYISVSVHVHMQMCRLE